MERKLILSPVLALTLSACGTMATPDMPRASESMADASALAACAEVSILLDRRYNFTAALQDFLDAVRTSGCTYTQFRVDTTDATLGSAYNDGYSRGQALEIVRAYRRSYALDWTALPFQQDGRVPEFHLKPVFLAPSASNAN